MHLARERISARVNAELEDRLWKHLSGLYTPLVTDVALNLSRVLDLDGKLVKTGGEMFLTPTGEILYYLVGGARRSLEVGSVSGSESHQLSMFRSAVEEVLGNGKKWTPLPSISERFKLVQEDAEPFRATPQDLEAAELLSRPLIRQLLAEVRDNPGVLLSAVKLEGADSLEHQANQLDRMGLVTRVFEVFCKDTGNKLLRTESYAALEEASSRGFKNFMSGRPILEERIEQLITLSDRGLRLARPNIWLAFLVARQLQEAGVPERDILWLQERDCQLLELFVAYQGALFVFGLHQNPVTADQAFRFLTRARYYQADAAFLICPAGLNRDAMQVMLRVNHAEPVFVIDDLGGLQARLGDVMKRSATDNVQRLLARFQELTALKVAELVGEHLLGPAPAAPEEEAEIEPLEPEPEAEHEVDRPQPEPEAQPTLASDELDALVEELLEDVASSGAVSDEELVEVGVTDEAEPALTADEPFEDFAPVEPAVEEPYEEPYEERGGTFSEELPEVDLLEHERSAEERLESTIRHILEDLQESGLTGRVKEVEDMIAAVAEVEECSGALASREGLLVAGRLETAPDPDIAVALQIELYFAFARATEEGELGPLYSMVVEGGASRLNILPALEDVNLVVHEGRAHHAEIDTAASLPGELVLREAILKKVMEDLGRLEGVQGNLVTSRDGLPIDYQVEEDLNLEVLGVVLTQALVDSEGVLERLEMAPARQVLLRTENRWYSVIPLDREAVMITLLAPDVPRDLWQHKLIGSAQMLASVFQ